MKGKIIEVYGMKKNLKEWADYLGISKQLLNYKIKKFGKDERRAIEDALIQKEIDNNIQMMNLIPSETEFVDGLDEIL